MSVSLSNSKDITVNKITVIQTDGTVLDLIDDVTGQINAKQNKLNNYPSPLTNMIFYNNNYIRSIKCSTGLTTFLETDGGNENYNNYEISIDPNINNLQNYYLTSYIDYFYTRHGNIF